MTAQWLLLLGAAALLVAWLLTRALRRYALATDLLDHPNHRSSHQQPTPRGGGIAIVASFMAVSLGIHLAGWLESPLATALIGAGALVAVLGFMDDRRHVPARWRLVGHVAAAAWVLTWIGALPPLPLLGHSVDLGIASVGLCALYIVWSINLFNFMDGIDGLASVEAITIAVPGAALAAWVRPDSPWQLAVMFAASVAGFLFWNFPRARIFMGDAGSGFLGLVVATLTLAIGRLSPPLLWSWFILGGCFMVDATTTLFQRWRLGEKVYEAHRSHAYQYASRKLGAHPPVTLAVAAINLGWLLPWATLVAIGKLDGLMATVVAFAPLVWLALRCKAGDQAAQVESAGHRA